MTRARKCLLAALALGIAGLVGGAGTFSALSDTTSNPGDSVAAGTVTLSDNDSAAAMLSLTNAVPGNTSTGCIRVTYSGSLSSNVRLYGTISGGLAPYLTLTVTRGTDPAPSFSSCAGFTPDASNYIGAGPGVIYSGTLSGYPGSYAAGIVDPLAGSPETWTSSESHSYRFSVTLENNLAARAQTGTASFTWEARNQ